MAIVILGVSYSYGCYFDLVNFEFGPIDALTPAGGLEAGAEIELGLFIGSPPKNDSSVTIEFDSGPVGATYIQNGERAWDFSLGVTFSPAPLTGTPGFIFAFP